EHPLAHGNLSDVDARPIRRGAAGVVRRWRARRVGRASKERRQREVTVLVALNDRARSVYDDPPHSDARRPLHLERGRLDPPGTHQLLLTVPDAQATHRYQAVHPGGHTSGE